MKKIIFLLCLSPFFTYAQKRIIPFKNSYIKYPYTIVSKYNYDETWIKLITMLREGDFSAKLIDKSTGNFCFILDDARFTTENSKDKEDTCAWAVSERIYYVGRNQYFSPKSAGIVWYAHITQKELPEFIIDSMRLSDPLKVYSHDLLFNEDTYKEFILNIVTTGKIEELINKYLR